MGSALINEIWVDPRHREDVESELVRLYLDALGLHVESIQNRLLHAVVKPTVHQEVRAELLAIRTDWTLKDIEDFFYSSMTDKLKQEKGIVFTPNPIVDYILDHTIAAYNKPTVCDFACGCGAFLIRAAEKLYRAHPEWGMIFILEELIFGVDILEDNVRRTRILLTLLALQYDCDQAEIDLNIQQYDSTEADVLNIFGKDHVLGGFDCIVGNPPYIRIQDLDMQTRAKLMSQYVTTTKGSINLYFAFLELGMKHLKPNGKLGYIVPNYFLKMDSAEPLREFLIQNRYFSKVLDFKDNLLFERIQTYSAVVFLDKEAKKSFSYALIDRYDEESFSDATLEFQTIDYADVSSDQINLLSHKDKQNIAKIEWAGSRLKISTGIATQKDSLYMIGYAPSDVLPKDGAYYFKEYQGELYPIEKAITKNLIKGGANIDFETGEQAKKPKIIYPYEKANGKIKAIPLVKMAALYPQALRYFEVIRDELGRRNNGRPKVNLWYEYGRSQALDCFGPKIILPTNAKKPKFVLFEEEALFNNGYAIYETAKTDGRPGTGYDLRILLKILNSAVMDYYIRNTSYLISGGYYCYQKKYIKNFSIPPFTEQELRFLATCTDQPVVDDFLIEKYKIER